ncbi:phosphonate transport system substrate-binding protein [Spiroplasma gladiatoris]|uniref:Phosphonate transport system substrate-binding protein n=1 Tax=Spiroplasma gladiatoris TaxID=2143 RepID=A0A4P7AJE3_9MOLU|nr:PhnD/SsuA/transferrin family substrate-binding protein [Spiroplasma gladiatoris]QBQ07863.1 phosphonate transport system substrate-binding protein [Spiroplasma gladiatoris]
MKKLLMLMGTISLIMPIASGVSSCSNSNKLIINFIPSVDPTATMATIKPLEAKLENKLKELDSSFNKKVEIIMASDYEAAGEALRSGTTDLAFLSVNTYENYRGEKQDDGTYKDAGIITVSSRPSIRSESTFEKFQKDNKFSNELASKYDFASDDSGISLANAYNKVISSSVVDKQLSAQALSDTILNKESDVSYYRSYVYANSNFVKNTLGNSVDPLNHEFKHDEVKKLITQAQANKRISLSENVTSSAGLLYPMLWLKNTMQFKDTELKKMYDDKLIALSSAAAAKGVTDDEPQFDIVFGWSDMREIIYKQDNPSVFKNSVMIGTSYGIPNDGIMYSRKRMDETFANVVRSAFISLVRQSENKELFDVYNHSNYIGLEENQSANQFEIANDEIITKNYEKIKSIKELVSQF